MRSALLLLSLWAAGCSNGRNFLLVSLTAEGLLRGIDHFRVAVANGGQDAAPFDVSPSPRPLDLTAPFTFLLSFEPARSGTVTASVEALDGAAHRLASASGMGDIVVGQIPEIAIVLRGVPANDLGPGDLPPVDAAPADISRPDDLAAPPGDGPPPDLAQPDLAPPDLAQPDLAPIQDLAPPPDLGPAPSVASFTPASGPLAGGTVITILGANFIKTPTVTVRGKAAANVAFTNAGQITATTPPATGPCGPGPVVVTNPDGQSATAPSPFSYDCAFTTNTLQIGATINGIIAADLDLDGKPDLAVSTAAPSIIPFRGTANGTFLGKAAIPVDLEPRGIAAGRFDADNIPDLVAPGYNAATVRVYTHDGQFGFTKQPAYTFGVNGDFPTSVAPADFNDDGKLDTAVTFFNTAPAVVHGDNIGNLGTPAKVGNVGIGSTHSAAAARFDGDNLPDLALVDNCKLWIFINDNQNKATFPAASVPQSIVTERDPAHVIAADLNGDGRADLVVTNRAIINNNCGPNGNSVSVLLGNGDGSFRAPVHYPTGATPIATVAGDFSGDGNIDLLVIHQTDKSAVLLFGAGDGTFRGKSTLPLGKGPRAVAAGGFNGDATDDFAIGADDNSLTVFLSM